MWNGFSAAWAVENDRELLVFYFLKTRYISRNLQDFRFHWKLKQPLYFHWKRNAIRGFLERLLNACEGDGKSSHAASGGRFTLHPLSSIEYYAVAKMIYFPKFARLCCSSNNSLSLTFPWIDALDNIGDLPMFYAYMLRVICGGCVFEIL